MNILLRYNPLRLRYHILMRVNPIISTVTCADAALLTAGYFDPSDLVSVKIHSPSLISRVSFKTSLR